MHINNLIDKINETRTQDPNDSRWSMVLDGAPVEMEVVEFLYSFTRMTKPKRILETGTNVGYSTVSLAQALKDNNENGIIDTLDVHDYKFDFGHLNNINKIIKSSLEYNPIENYDILFLDSLRELLYDEFVKYWPLLNDDGYILIHDVRTQPEKKETLYKIEKNFNLKFINMKSARGLAIGHKIENKNLLKHGEFNWK